MTYTPTACDLLTLEAQLESDGFSAHDFTIVDLVSQARSAHAPKQLTDTIANTSLPEMRRRSALTQLAAVWPEPAEAVTDQPSHFSNLLDSWRTHQDLRKNGATVAELVESSDRLDLARVQNRETTS